MVLPAQPSNLEGRPIVVMVGVYRGRAANLTAPLHQVTGHKRPLHRQMRQVTLRMLPAPVRLARVGLEAELTHLPFPKSLCATVDYQTAQRTQTMSSYENRLIEIMGEDYNYDRDSLTPEKTEQFIAVLKEMPGYAKSPAFLLSNHTHHRAYDRESNTFADIMVENTSGFGIFAFIGDEEIGKNDAA